jgi:hypothetical protein
MSIAEIEGLIIALIVVVRVVVYLTPTKADDQYVGKIVPKALKVMYIVFGIDLSKGKRRYVP